MKKTKLIPLKVTKIYFYDPNKLPSPKTVPSIGKNYSVTSIFSTYFTNFIVANGPSLSLNMMENGNNSTQSVKADYEKGGFNMNWTEFYWMQ